MATGDGVRLQSRLQKIKEKDGVAWFMPGIDRDLPGEIFQAVFRDYESVCRATHDMHLRIDIPDEHGKAVPRSLFYKSGEIIAALRKVELESGFAELLGSQGVNWRSISFGRGGFQSPSSGRELE